MKYLILCSTAIFAAVLLSFGFGPAIGGSDIQDFHLKNVDGKLVSMRDYPDAKGFIIVFTCNHCPFAKLYPPRLNAMNAKYKPLGYPLIAISSTDTLLYEEDTYGKMVEKAQNEGFNFPYLFDETQAVAKNFKAQKTPHAYVLQKTKQGLAIRYNGAIDDNGGEPENVTQPFVAQAVDALLAHKPVENPETKSIGCQIYFRDGKK
jgi:peroxiredoxin